MDGRQGNQLQHTAAVVSSSNAKDVSMLLLHLLLLLFISLCARRSQELMALLPQAINLRSNFEAWNAVLRWMGGRATNCNPQLM